VYILIPENGALSLEDADNMKNFSIVGNIDPAKSTAFLAMAKPAEDDHYWIDADSVIELSPRSGDQQWIDGFWDMLRKVEPYGFSDLVTNRVKAHVEHG
jgi:hypothetical protein